jgi:hypothetical protein
LGNINGEKKSARGAPIGDTLTRDQISASAPLKEKPRRTRVHIEREAAPRWQLQRTAFWCHSATPLKGTEVGDGKLGNHNVLPEKLEKNKELTKKNQAD